MAIFQSACSPCCQCNNDVFINVTTNNGCYGSGHPLGLSVLDGNGFQASGEKILTITLLPPSGDNLPPSSISYEIRDCGLAYFKSKPGERYLIEVAPPTSICYKPPYNEGYPGGVGSDDIGCYSPSCFTPASSVYTGVCGQGSGGVVNLGVDVEDCVCIERKDYTLTLSYFTWTAKGTKEYNDTSPKTPCCTQCNFGLSQCCSVGSTYESIECTKGELTLNMAWRPFYWTGSGFTFDNTAGSGDGTSCGIWVSDPFDFKDLDTCFRCQYEPLPTGICCGSGQIPKECDGLYSEPCVPPTSCRTIRLTLSPGCFGGGSGNPDYWKCADPSGTNPNDFNNITLTSLGITLFPTMEDAINYTNPGSGISSPSYCFAEQNLYFGQFSPSILNKTAPVISTNPLYIRWGGVSDPCSGTDNSISCLCGGTNCSTCCRGWAADSYFNKFYQMVIQ